MNRKLGEDGVTLVELLAAIAIVSIAATLAVSVFVSGMKAYNNITAENAVRDEADYVMTRMMTALYTVKLSEVAEENLASKTTNQSYLVINSGGKKKEIGFFSGKVKIGQEEIKPLNGNIAITDKSKIEKIDRGYYRIHLVLLEKKRQKEYELKSEIPIINDFEVTNEED